MSNRLCSIMVGIALAAFAPGVSIGQDQPRAQRPGTGAKKTSNPHTGAFGLPKGIHQAGEDQPHAAAGDATRVDGLRSAFTLKYLALRDRLLEEFEHNGQIAASADGKRRTFSDQTLYMGFALLTFAGEARILHESGHDTRPSEEVLRRLLHAFEAVDKDAERERYHTSVPGSFLRDYVKDWPGFQVESDFLASAGSVGEDDMSRDQVVSLMMGWWGVSHWSTDAGDRGLAKSRADRVLGFLCNERFMIDRPGTRLGTCKLCNGKGFIVLPGAGVRLHGNLVEELVKLHHECPVGGPSDRPPSTDWCKDNHWVRCTDLTRGNGNNAYNGLDFLSLEVLLRLAGAGSWL